MSYCDERQKRKAKWSCLHLFIKAHLRGGKPSCFLLVIQILAFLEFSDINVYIGKVKIDQLTSSDPLVMWFTPPLQNIKY